MGKWECIREMASISRTTSSEVIVECLEFYGVCGTKDLTAKQAEDFLKRKKREGVKQKRRHTSE